MGLRTSKAVNVGLIVNLLAASASVDDLLPDMITDPASRTSICYVKRCSNTITGMGTITTMTSKSTERNHASDSGPDECWRDMTGGDARR